MKDFLKKIIKYVKNVFLTSVIISILDYIAAAVFKLKLSSTFLYTALICFIAGGLSIFGNISMTSDYRYVQSESISSRGLYKNTADNYKSRNSSLKFLIFMAVTGIILLIIAGILDVYSL